MVGKSLNEKSFTNSYQFFHNFFFNTIIFLLICPLLIISICTVFKTSINLHKAFRNIIIVNIKIGKLQVLIKVGPN